jgi:hypothetical protein
MTFVEGPNRDWDDKGSSPSPFTMGVLKWCLFSDQRRDAVFTVGGRWSGPWLWPVASSAPVQFVNYCADCTVRIPNIDHPLVEPWLRPHRNPSERALGRLERPRLLVGLHMAARRNSRIIVRAVTACSIFDFG